MRARLIEPGVMQDIARHFTRLIDKKSYVNWNLDSVEDEIILNHLTKLSNGMLSVPEGTELSKFIPNPKQQNFHARRKKKNNRNNRNQHRN